MTPSEAKFAREVKPDPTNWIIVPIRGGGGFKVVYVGVENQCNATKSK